MHELPTIVINNSFHLGYYFIFAVIIIFIFIAFSHFMNYTTITNEPLSILQSEQPIPDVIENMMAKKQPIIFLYELELWDGVDLLIGYPYNEISDVLKDNMELIKTIKTVYLRPYSLSFTKDWLITLENKSDTWDSLSNIPTREKSYGHFIANLSGLMVVCLIHPKKINNTGPTIPDMINQKTDFKSVLADDKSQVFDYITVPVRPSNMIYIPYGWYYWIYCGQSESHCTYLDIKNITWFG